MTTPRIQCIDTKFVEQRLADFCRSKEKTQALLQSEPGKLQQTRYTFLGGECATIGFYLYGLGFPIKEVAQAFREAASAYLAVFQLRGTEAPFPVTVLTIDPEKAPGDPAFVIGDRPLYPSDSKDYSPTNSKTGLEAIFLALIGHDRELASGIAELIWDPPNASYICPTSEVCTPNEQHFAYSVKHLLKNDNTRARSEIGQLRTAKREGWVSGVLKMTEGIVACQTPLFLEGLREELSRHSKEAKKESNSWRPEFFLSVYGLGMAILATQEGIVNVDDFPQAHVYLPLELIRSG
jgi:hypothetical protein